MDVTMSDAFKAATADWSDEDFLKQREVLQLVEKLKDRSEYLLTDKTRLALQKAEDGAKAAQQRYLQASFVKSASSEIGHKVSSNEDQQLCVKGRGEEFVQQLKRLKEAVLVAESCFGSVLDPLDQPEVTEAFKVEIHDLLKEKFRKHKEKLLHQMGELQGSSLQEAVHLKCTARDAKKSSIFTLLREYADCVSEFKKVYEEYITEVLSKPINEAAHTFLKQATHLYDEYFRDNEELENDMELYRQMDNLFEATKNRLEHEVELKRTTVQQKESRLQGFECIWSPNVEDLISLYKSVINDIKGLRTALTTTSSESG